MLEWLKTVLVDAYTPEIDTAVSQEIGKGFVARTDFNTKTAKVTELETEVKQLREGIKTRDTQLSELKKSAGDNAELQKQIDTLTQQNKEQKAAYDKELATVKLTAAVDAELTAAGSKSNIAVRALLAAARRALLPMRPSPVRSLPRSALALTPSRQTPVTASLIFPATGRKQRSREPWPSAGSQAIPTAPSAPTPTSPVRRR